MKRNVVTSLIHFYPNVKRESEKKRTSSHFSSSGKYNIRKWFFFRQTKVWNGVSSVRRENCSVWCKLCANDIKFFKKVIIILSWREEKKWKKKHRLQYVRHEQHTGKQQSILSHCVVSVPWSTQDEKKGDFSFFVFIYILFKQFLFMWHIKQILTVWCICAPCRGEPEKERVR